LKFEEINMKKITRSTTLREVLMHPHGARMLEKYKIPCLHCPMAVYEMGKLKIGEVAKTYGIDIRGLLEELNSAAGNMGRGKAKKRG
jgi:hypothetical protein